MGNAGFISSTVGRRDLARNQELTDVRGLMSADGRFEGHSSQRTQCPLLKEYTINHNIKAPIL